MATKIKIRAREKGGTATVKVLMSHPMETGLRKDKKTGEKIPAHYISEVTCEHKGQVVMKGYMGPGVSKNPYMSFDINNASKGDAVKISWVDNNGENASLDGTIS